MMPASHSQRSMLREGTGFALAIQVVDTAAAEAGVLGVGADVGAHVPAALALGVRQRAAHRNSSLASRMTVRLRADEDKAQVVAERSEQFVLFAVAVQFTAACSDEPMRPRCAVLRGRA
jgi:hypothetical protein